MFSQMLAVSYNLEYTLVLFPKKRQKKAAYFTDICVSLLAHAVILENASERENRHGTLYWQCSKSPCGVLALRILVVAQKACGEKQTFISSQAQLSRN